MLYSNYHGEIKYDPKTGKQSHLDNQLRNYFPDPNFKGVIFDVGAFEPIRISNSYHFEMNGWDSYCFEANTESIPLLKKYRKNVFNYAISDENKPEVSFHVVTLHDMPGNWTASYSAIEISDDYKRVFGWNNNFDVKKIIVPQKTLNTVIKEEISNVTSIDILSIDVEGAELNCLKGLDLIKYDPKVILLENATPTNKIIQDYLESFGYKLDVQEEYNQFYVSKNFKY